MHRITAFPLPGFSFRSRHPALDVIARLERALLRWRSHARLEAITAALSDVKFNPFLFQIESSR